MPAFQSTRAAPVDGVDAYLGRLMGVLLLGASVALLDTTIIAVAIDDLAEEFDSSVGSTQWVATGYLLAMAAVIPTMGWLVERCGSRRVWLGAVGVFLLGSALCSAAWSVGSLIAFRVVQGLGGGLILPLVQTILAQAAGPERVGRVMGYIGIPGQFAPILGPVLGGLLLAGPGWRWIFLMNVPLCFLALAVAARELNDDEPRRPAKLDRAGMVFLLPGIVAVLWACTVISEQTAPFAPAAMALGFGIALVLAFGLHARRLGSAALLDLTLLRHRSLGVATAMMFAFGFCLYGTLILLPLFYQRVRGVEVGEIGLLLAPQGLGTMAALWLAGRYVQRVGPRAVGLVGTGLYGAGVAGLALLGTNTGPAATAALSGCLMILGGGLGATGVAATTAAYCDLPPPATARGTSLINVVQRLGAALGTSVIVLILQVHLADATATDRGRAAAFTHTLWWATAFALTTILLAALLPARSPRTTAPPPAHERK